jgi:uncharacterized membrane protein required for colicin V production
MLNGFDLTIGALLLLALMFGYRRGLVSQVISIGGFLIAYLAAWKFADKVAPFVAKLLPLQTFANYGKYEFAAKALHADTYILHILSFALLFIAVKVGLMIAGYFLNIVVKAPGLNGLNRWSGALLALLEIGLLAVIAVHVMSLLPSDRIQGWLAHSSSAPYLLQLLPKLTDGLNGFWTKP